MAVDLSINQLSTSVPFNNTKTRGRGGKMLKGHEEKKENLF